MWQEEIPNNCEYSQKYGHWRQMEGRLLSGIRLSFSPSFPFSLFPLSKRTMVVPRSSNSLSSHREQAFLCLLFLFLLPLSLIPFLLLYLATLPLLASFICFLQFALLVPLYGAVVGEKVQSHKSDISICSHSRLPLSLVRCHLLFIAHSFFLLFFSFLYTGI